MDIIALVVGVGIVSFLLAYFTIHLDKEHFLLKLLTAFFFLTLLVLIPKGLIDENDYCDVVVSNTTYYNATNTTTYEYERFCDTNTKKTASIFHAAVVWFNRLFATYVFLYLIYVIFLQRGLTRVIKDIKKGPKKLFKRKK